MTYSCRKLPISLKKPAQEYSGDKDREATTYQRSWRSSHPWRSHLAHQTLDHREDQKQLLEQTQTTWCDLTFYISKHRIIVVTDFGNTFRITVFLSYLWSWRSRRSFVSGKPFGSLGEGERGCSAFIRVSNLVRTQKLSPKCYLNVDI